MLLGVPNCFTKTTFILLTLVLSLSLSFLVIGDKILAPSTTMPDYIDNNESIIILDEQYSRVTNTGITYSDQRASILDTYSRGNDLQILESYPEINALHVKINNEALQNLLSIGVVKHAEKQKIFHTLLQDSNPLIRANETWVKTGFNGTGIKVCIIDTGIDNFSTELPRPLAKFDFTSADWCIDSRAANTGNLKQAFNYSLNVTNGSVGFLEIGAWWSNVLDRYDVRVFYPNNQMANSTAGQVIYTGVPNNFFVSVNVSINTTGSYTIELNETTIGSNQDYATIIWGSSIVNESTKYKIVGDFGCTSYLGSNPVGTDPKAFFNNNTHDDAAQASHGTHVAGTVARQGRSLNTTYKGVAPGASLLIAKVFSNTAPVNSSPSATTSDILDAMRWCVLNGADVVSMSLGATAGPGCSDSESLLVDSLTDNGTLFVIAAGNTGPGLFTVTSPGCARKALTVGATNNSDVIAGFSSRGPSGIRLKPEITGPGVNIISSIITNTLGLLSGTSMATPHVSGGAAILKQSNSSYTPAMLKVALLNSANQTVSGLGTMRFDYGLGRLDVFTAVNSTYVTIINISNNTLENFTVPVPTGIENIKMTIYWEENSSDTHNNIFMDLFTPAGVYASSSNNTNFTIQQIVNTSPGSGNWRLTIFGNNVFGTKKVYIASNRPLTGGNPILINQHGYAYTYFYLNNTAKSPDGGPPEPIIKWKFSETGIGLSFPILANGGYVYTGSNNSGNVYALNASNGSIIWNFTTGAGMVHHVVSSNGTVFATSEGRNLFAINGTTGAKIWNFSTGGPVLGPMPIDDIVYIASLDRNLYAINFSTGAMLWSFPISGFVSSANTPPAAERLGLNSHKLYLSFVNFPGQVGDNETVALQTNITGFARLWINNNYTLGTGDTETQNIVDNGLLYRANNLAGRQVEALNKTNGSQVWYSDLEGSNAIVASMALDNQRLIVTTKSNSNGTVFFLNPTTGATLSNFSVDAGVISQRIAPSNFLFLTTVYSNGSTNITNIVALHNLAGVPVWNLSREPAQGPGGGPFVLDGVLYTNPPVINQSDKQTLYAIEPIGIIIISPPNKTLFPILPSPLKASFFYNNTSSSPQHCSLFIDGISKAVNPLSYVDTRILFTVNLTLSDGTYPWFIRCTRPSGITFTSETRLFTIDTNFQAPNITIATNATNAIAGSNVLVNVTASDNKSNMTLLSVTIFDPTNDIAGLCGINTTNATTTNVNCVFSNSSSGGIYTIFVNATDGINNSAQASARIIYSNPTPSLTIGGVNLANVTIFEFSQLRPNYSLSFPSIGGGNESNSTTGLKINETVMPIFIDKPFFAGPTTFESLGYNYTVLINVSAGLANGTLVNVSVKTGSNIPARMETLSLRTVEGNKTMNSLRPAIDGQFTIFTNNIRGSSTNNSGAVSGTFSFPNRNNPYTQVNLTINASNSSRPYQINVTLLFPSKGPAFVINQSYTGYDFKSPPPIGAVLDQGFYVDINNSEPFFSPTNVFLEFMFPQNTTIFNTDGRVNSTEQIASNAQISWFNFTSGLFENATSNLAAYNITPIGGCFNVTNNALGSLHSGKNISPCMTGFRYNLGSTSLSWRYGSMARLNVTARLNFTSLGESKVGGGIPGIITNCNVTVSVPVQGGSITIPSTCAPNTCSASSLNVTVNGQQLNSSQFKCGSIIITGVPLDIGPNDISISYFVPTGSAGGSSGGSSTTQTITISNVEANCSSVKATIMPTTGVTTRLLYHSDSGYLEVVKTLVGGVVSFNTNFSGSHQIESTGSGYLPATVNINVPSCTENTSTQTTINELKSNITEPSQQPESINTTENTTQSSLPKPEKPKEDKTVDFNLQIKQETQQIIQEVQKNLETAKNNGKNVANAQALLAQALAAYNNGDYSNARVIAFSANKTIAATPQVVSTTAESTQVNSHSLLLPIAAIIGLVAVAGVVVYYAIRRR